MMLTGTSFELRPRGLQHDHPCLSRRGSLHMSSFASASGVLMSAGDGGVPANIPGDKAVGIGLGLQLAEDPLPGPVALPAPKQAIDGLPGPVADGQVPPRRPGPGPPADPVNQLAFGPPRRPAGLLALR